MAAIIAINLLMGFLSKNVIFIAYGIIHGYDRHLLTFCKENESRKAQYVTVFGKPTIYVHFLIRETLILKH